jgi:transformation/transcription domain-associated protein
MQALVRHLRPAPYPYGLLTLRLLGKLGGKNRLFLRDPIPQQFAVNDDAGTKLQISAHFNPPQNESAMDEFDFKNYEELKLPLPLKSCVDMLRDIAIGFSLDYSYSSEHDKRDEDIQTIDPSFLWDSKIEDLDIQSYSYSVITSTRHDQAVACLDVLQAALSQMHAPNSMDFDAKSQEPGYTDVVYIGLMYACMIDATEQEALMLIREQILTFNPKLFSVCFATFMSEPSALASKVGLGILDIIFCINTGNNSFKTSLLLDALICSLCETSCRSSWSRHFGLMQAIDKMTSALGDEWSRKYEVNLINAAFLAVKSQPHELSEASIRALSGFVRVCRVLYGEHWVPKDTNDNYIWDVLSVEGSTGTSRSVEGSTSKRTDEYKAVKHRPSEDVFKIIIYEMTSPQQLVR